MIPATHPVVRAMAEETAMEVRCAANGRAIGSLNVDAFATLLLDFTRPATRDVWVRWLVRRRLDLAAKKDGGTCHWHAGIITQVDLLRNNPAALEAAVSAALETAP